MYPTNLLEHLGFSPFNLPQLRDRADAPVKEVFAEDRVFRLGWERFLPAEQLFDGAGLHQLVMRVIDRAVEVVVEQGATEAPESTEERETVHAARQAQRDALHAQLLERIVLSGGSSKMPGLTNRLEAELTALLKLRTGVAAKPKVHPAIRGDMTTWVGGSVLAGTSTFAEQWCMQSANRPPNEQMDLETSSPSSSDEEMEVDEDDDDDTSDQQSIDAVEETAAVSVSNQASDDSSNEPSPSRGADVTAPAMSSTPQAPSHRGVDYSRWDAIVDSDDD